MPHRLLLTVALALVLLVLAPSRPVLAQDVAPRLTVASYNINYGNVDLDQVLLNVIVSNADIVCLQEVNGEAERRLRAGLASHYAHASFHPMSWAQGFAILSRYPIRDVRYLDAEHGYFGAQIATVDVDGVDVHVANVHLQPNLPKKGDGRLDLLARAWALEGTRLAETQRILEALPDGPRLFVGDLNTITGMTTVAFLDSVGLADAAEEVGDEAALAPTWRWSWDGSDWAFRLDYVFHSPHFSTVDVAVLSEGPSDHFLVVGVLELVEAGRAGTGASQHGQ